MRSRPGRLLRSPVLATLLLAPFLGECLSTSMPPLDLLLPWNLVLLAALYGSGALLCRELAHRSGTGVLGLCLLAAAYGVYEEALVVRSWFDPDFQDTLGDASYSRVWHTNLLLAGHLTVFHVAVSVCSTVVLVERLRPERRHEAWLGRRGLVVAGVALLLVPFGYGTLGQGPLGPQLAAAALVVALVAAALRVPRSAPTAPTPPVRRRAVPAVAFVCTAAHFVLTYVVASTGLPWPVGLTLALAPVPLGVVVVRRLGRPDPLSVVTGVLAFFVLLDVVVGLGGRYDFTLGGLATAVALWWLGRRSPRVSAG